MRLFLLTILVVSCANGFAQLSKGDTNSVGGKKVSPADFGYSTTGYFYEDDVLVEINERNQLDSALDNHHVFEGIVERDGDVYQDLGNLGTARRNLYFQLPTQTGVQLGLKAFTSYGFAPERIKYFDTQSPYSALYYVQGSKGQQIFDATFNRNINSRCGIGFDFNRVVSNQQGGASFEENHTNGFNFEVHGHFTSKEDKYNLLANYIHFKHSITELGGAVIDSGETKASLFDFTNVDYQLTDVETQDARHTVHIYQDYKFSPKIKVFNTLESNRVHFGYLDESPASNLAYYTNYYGTDTSTIDQTVAYKSYTGQLGVGFTDSLQTILVYSRANTFLFDHINSTTSNWENQFFLGGRYVNRFVSSKVEFSSDANVDAAIKVRLGELKLEGRYLIYSPNLIQRHFSGELFQWTNNFGNQKALQVTGSYKLEKGSFTLEPAIAYKQLQNYIYFDQNGAPDQLSTTEVVINPECYIGWSPGRFKMFNRTTGFSSSNDVLRAPALFNHTRIYFESILYSSPFQIGVDTYFRSSWSPYGYVPVTQQFALQEEFVANSYLLGDIFFNIKLKYARVFVKFNHFNQGMMSQDGYFMAPNYAGLQRLFVFGVKWEFFD